jgi:hypothetical protein
MPRHRMGEASRLPVSRFAVRVHGTRNIPLSPAAPPAPGPRRPEPQAPPVEAIGRSATLTRQLPHTHSLLFGQSRAEVYLGQFRCQTLIVRSPSVGALEPHTARQPGPFHALLLRNSPASTATHSWVARLRFLPGTLRGPVWLPLPNAVAGEPSRIHWVHVRVENHGVEVPYEDGQCS